MPRPSAFHTASTSASGTDLVSIVSSPVIAACNTRSTALAAADRKRATDEYFDTGLSIVIAGMESLLAG
jgi:hypothetical protein